jgi:hypothetical protein
MVHRASRVRKDIDPTISDIARNFQPRQRLLSLRIKREEAKKRRDPEAVGDHPRAGSNGDACTTSRKQFPSPLRFFAFDLKNWRLA